MRRRQAKGEAKPKGKNQKLNFVQDYLGIRNLRNGILEMADGRYVKILEIEPINFTLRSDEEQYNIISSFASWLKISPMRLQFKSVTRKADSDKHITMVKGELALEDNEQCRALGEDYLNLIRDVGNCEALTRRFFLIFEYEATGRHESNDYAKIYSAIQTVEHNARAYFLQCGNTIIQPKDPDEATAEILYMFFNRNSCVDEPFPSRVNRVVVDTMAAEKKVIGIDPVPNIPIEHFLSPRGIDLTHYNYIVMDGRYYTILYIRGNGYPSKVRAGWMSTLINAGEGIDIDIHFRRENRSKAIDKVAQRIRWNRTKIKGMQDTSTDYEELANSIQAGYYIKNGIANDNEDLCFMSTFIIEVAAPGRIRLLHEFILVPPISRRRCAPRPAPSRSRGDRIVRDGRDQYCALPAAPIAAGSYRENRARPPQPLPGARYEEDPSARAKQNYVHPHGGRTLLRRRMLCRV